MNISTLAEILFKTTKYHLNCDHDYKLKKPQYLIEDRPESRLISLLFLSAEE